MNKSNSILISALQHFLFCPRQYALIHLEQAWAENKFTAEGQVLHKNAHDGKSESRPGIRISRGLKIGSTRLGISGVCDVVEFHGKKPHYTKIIPIEYKRGKPKSHKADEIQLCAQAICLEEMTGISIKQGFLFYGKTRRRTSITFDTELRSLLLSCIEKIHEIQNSTQSPAAKYSSKRCNSCSLIEICQPKLNNTKQTAAKWFNSTLSEISDLLPQK